MKTPGGWLVEATADTVGKAKYRQTEANGHVCEFELDMSSDASATTKAQEQILIAQWGMVTDLLKTLIAAIPKPSPAISAVTGVP